MNYTPRSNYCFARQCNDPMQSGLVIVGQDSEIYEIVKMPDEVKTEYKDFNVGTKFIVKNNWRGFKVYEDSDTRRPVYCMDFQSIIAIIEQ